MNHLVIMCMIPVKTLTRPHFLPVFFLLTFQGFSQIIDVSKPQQQYHTLYFKNETDTLPSFRGGPDSLFQFITGHFHAGSSMPVSPKKTFLTIAACTIDSNGVLTEVYLEKPADSRESLPVETELELLRVFRLMPAWNPGYKEGRKVNAMVYVPLRFMIREGGMEIYNSGPEYVAGDGKNNKNLKWAIIAVSIVLFTVILLKVL